MEKLEKQKFKGQVRVIDRLESLIEPLTKEQLELLEQSLLDEGRAYSPLWLWGDVLVDGHHRYKLCKKHDLPFTTMQVYETAVTIEDLEYRIKRDAIAQRNLPASVESRYRADMVKHQMSLGASKSKAVATVAKETDVTERQVYRDVQRSESIEKLDEEVKPEAEQMSDASVKKLSKLPKDKQKEVVKESKKTGKSVAKEIAKVEKDPKEMAKKAASIANQHRDKLVRAIDDYHQHIPNMKERDRLVKIAQSITLWS